MHMIVKYSAQMKQIANKHNVELREGVYCALGKRKEDFVYKINQ